MGSRAQALRVNSRLLYIPLVVGDGVVVRHHTPWASVGSYVRYHTPWASVESYVRHHTPWASVGSYVRHHTS